MHGLLDSITFAKIVAIDLGKFNSVACVYDSATAVHSFVSLASSPQTIHDPLTQHAGARSRRRHTARSIQ